MAVNDVATICGPVPRKIWTFVTPLARQCAAVSTARGAITVPEHDPSGPLSSRMLTRTTAAVFVQSLPLTIAVPIAPHAPPGIGDGDGDVGVVGPELPPPQAGTVRAIAAITARTVCRGSRMDIPRSILPLRAIQSAPCCTHHDSSASSTQ